MASEKNITMRQYNGVDYDTLYPKTIAEQVIGIYSKDEILGDATKTIYGLGADAVPNDVFNWIGKFNQYWWNRRKITKEITLGSKVNNTRIMYLSPATGTGTIYYADSIIITESGEIALSNLDNSISVGYNTYTNANTLKGKYIRTPQNNYNADYIIYYIPEDSSLDREVNNSSNYSEIFMTTQTPAITISYSQIENVYSSDEFTYPHSGSENDYEYAFLGKPFEKIINISSYDTIEHIGAGTFGNIDIIFPVIPKIVFFDCGTENKEISPYIWGLGSLTVNTGSVSRIRVVPSDKTLTVVSNSSTMNALDKSGVVYTVAYLY